MSTIAELLTLGGCQFKAYDLGRRVEKLSRADYLAFEQGEAPYPSPIQGHACLALVFSKPEQAQQPFIWLLKFPLDEQSHLQYAARDHFLSMVIEALGNDIANVEVDTEALNNHPYAFKPGEEKLALLNARIKKELRQSASLYFESAFDYYCKKPTAEGWQALGIQGIADLVLRLDEKEVTEGLAAQLESLPEPAFNALAQCLEHVTLPAPLVEAIVGLPTSRHNSFWLRALTGAPDERLYSIVEAQLAQTSSLEELIAISARHWRVLNQPERVLAFLEALVKVETNAEVFAALVADLNALPTCRSACMAALRLPNRSEVLGQAIGQLFASYRTTNR